MKTNKGCKFFKAALNYLGDDKEFLEKLSNSLGCSSLTIEETNMFLMMFEGFRMMYNVKCAFFKGAVYTDGKYTLNVRRDLHNRITILFDINPHYDGDWLN